MRRVKLDRIDRRILHDLQDKGRMTNVELANRVKITAPPCLRRVPQHSQPSPVQRTRRPSEQVERSSRGPPAVGVHKFLDQRSRLQRLAS